MVKRQSSSKLYLKKLTQKLTAFGPMNWLMRQAIRVVVPRRRIGAGVVLFNADGDILLLKHAFHGRVPWGLPGGWLDRRENPLDGAIRELREETGLKANISWPIYVGATGAVDGIDVYYLATEPEGEISLSYEIIEARWFRPNQLPFAMYPKTRLAIDLATSMYQRGSHA